jgi:hypothetical protein
MEKVELNNSIGLTKSFVDVLYLTNRDQMPFEVKQLFDQKKLSYRVLHIKDFSKIRNNLDLIGTVVIDAKGARYSRQGIQIIESLETKNIGVIMLTDQPEVPAENSFLSVSKTDFSPEETSEVFSLDELWLRISSNLSYRKNNTKQAASPANRPKQVKAIYKNKLAEQMNMAKVLVDNLAEQLRLAGLVQKDFLPSKLPNSDKISTTSSASTKSI